MLSETTRSELRTILGEEGFLCRPEDLIVYSYDGFPPEFLPEGVLLPGSTSEVSRIMAIATRDRIPITPRGAGTNICGGSVAKEGGLIMAFHRMNGILRIEKGDRCAVVQPGVVNGDLQKAVGRVGLMFPPDPASMYVSTIGGNVALNAGGPRGVKYGVTRDYLLGLEAVLPSGAVIHTGGKTLKNVTGYDLTRLLCGSEGTLGIITEITLRLIPLPPARTTLQAVYGDLHEAAATVSAIIGAGIVPVTLELMDRVVLEIIRDYGGADFPEEAQALLLIEVDGHPEAVRSQGREIDALCRERGATAVDMAETEAHAERLWQARRTAFGAVARQRPHCIVEDATVPVTRLPDMVREIVGISERYRLRIGVLAHAGDGNLHPLIMTDLRDRDEGERVDRALEDMCRAALAMGGTLSGEHGIGIAKKRFLGMELDPATIAVMRGIKQVFDPQGILNPGSFL